MNLEVPPDGTKCVDCGCCIARIYSGGDPICFECDQGIPCKGRQPSVPKASIDKVEKLADGASKKTVQASFKVARLLKPQRKSSPRKAKSVTQNTNPPEPAPQRAVVSTSTANAPIHRSQSYSDVINDLTRQRDELDQLITSLKRYLAKPAA